MEYFAFQWHITDSYTDIIDLVVEDGVDTPLLSGDIALPAAFSRHPADAGCEGRKVRRGQ